MMYALYLRECNTHREERDVTKGEKFGSGGDAIQSLVDTTARLKAIRAWQAELAEWQRQLGTEESKLVHQRRDAIDYITKLAEEDPSSLGLRVSDTTTQSIDTGEAMMSEAFERTKGVAA